ncbi:hypothetical protein PoB_005827900 [Plakobranchus ocellatus]|uniref:Acyl-ACP thioesterase n=1 Tax=Plakobranchus ocellatus TaxID=259542 RepID=A0AAV4CGA8_9GAST|nr:hypothetical protein PoB_005827900 [Plakobranchus ocellatus]
MATQVQDYAIDIDTDALKVESHFPGISYDDFDRGGGISPWKICRMFEAGRSIPFFQGNFLDFNQLVSRNFGFFVLGGDYYFDSCLWEVTRKYHFFPYKIRLELINVGQTSLTIRQVLVNKLDSKEIATFYGKLVYVDKLARRPTALPYWHREKFGHLKKEMDGQAKIMVDSKKVVPEGAFQVETLVAASDTDHNGHTNQGSYVRFCLDAAETANKAGVLECVQGDICFYPILKMTVSYKGETYHGDRLITSVWPDDLSPPVLHFAIKRQGKLVLTASITFKPRPKSKL